MKRIGIAVLALALVAGAALIGFAYIQHAQKTPQEMVSRLLGIDATEAEVLEDYDSHSGNGDGDRVIILQFPKGTVPMPAGRKPLPLTRNLTAAIYGIEETEGDTVVGIGPFRSQEAPEIPEISNGWYWFVDDNNTGDPHSDAELLDRGSFNYTLVLCDLDTSTLYYIRVDT